MESPFSISNFFIRKSIETGTELTPMKLIKLVYLSHGWYLGFESKPLIAEPIHAWKYGPVISSLYHHFKQYGSQQITSYATSATGNTYFEIEKKQDLEPFLERIWEVYGKFSGVQLSAITHEPGSPWHIVWNKRAGNSVSDMMIPDSIIQEYYSKRISESPTPPSQT